MRFHKKIEPHVKTLASNPWDLEAREAVERFYAKKGQWPDLAKTWEHLAKSGDGERAGNGVSGIFWALAGIVWDEQVHDVDRARECLSKALEHGGGPAAETEARTRLRRLLSDAEDWDGLTGLLEQEAATTGDPVAKADVLYQLGRVWEDRRERSDNAMLQYREAFRTDPGCIKALHAARALYEAMADFEMVATLLRLEAEQAQDQTRRLDLMTEQGYLLATEVGDVAQAIECFQRVLEADPGHEAAARNLEEIERFLVENADAIEGGEQGEEPPARTAPSEAAVAEATEAVAEFRAQTEAEAARAAADAEAATRGAAPAAGPDDVEAAEVRSRTDETAHEDDGILFGFDDEEKGESAGPRGQEPAEPETAPAAPPEPAPEPETEPVAAAHPEPEAEHEAEPAAAAPPEPAPKPEPAPTAATGAEEAGLPAWDDYVAGLTDDADVEAAGMAEAAKWRDLQRVLLERFGDDKAEAFARLGRLAEMRMAPDKAVDAWRQVAQSTGGEGARGAEARARLMGLYHAAEKWNAFLEVCKQEVEATPASATARKVDLLRQMVAVYRDRLNLDHMVSQTWQQVLQADPRSADALDALEAQFERLGRWPDLIGILQRKAEGAGAAGDVARRVELNKRIARLFVDRFSNQAEAIKSYEAVLDAAPGDRESLDYLRAMHEKRRDWEKLVAVLRREAALRDDPASRAAALKEVARVATERMKRSPIPAETWQGVLDLLPDDREALDALHEIHERDKSWAPLAAILERKAAVVGDDAARVEILQLLGHVHGDRLKAADQAIDVWRRVLALSPDHPKAQEALKRSFIEARDWDALTAQYASRDAQKDLVRILESQVGVVAENPVKVDLLFRAAALWNEALGDPDRAVRAVERVLQLDPDNLEAAERLVPVYEEKRNFKHLVECHEVRERHALDTEARREILTTLARLEDEQLADPAKAFGWLLLAVAAVPTDAAVRGEAVRLAGRCDGWERLADALAKARAHVDDPAALRSLDLTRGRILFDELSRLDEATEVFDRVVAEDPESVETLSALEALHRRTGRWPDLLDVLGRQLPLVQDPQERRRILRDLAAVQEEHLGAPDAAIASWRRLADEFPQDPEPLADLRRLYAAAEDWPNLAEALRREVDVRVAAGQSAAADGDTAPAERRAPALRFELATLLLDRLDAPGQALAELTQALAEAPDHEGTIDALEGLLARPELLEDAAALLDPVLRARGEWDRLIGVLARRRDALDDGRERQAVIVDMARVHEDHRLEAREAFAAYGEAFRLLPDDEESRARLEALADRLSAHGELVAWYGQAASAGVSAELAMTLHSVVAVAQEQHLGDLEAAQAAWRGALEVDPGHIPALAALERLYTRTESWAELPDVYRRRRDLSDSDEERRDLSRKLAHLQEDLLNADADAIGTWREVLAQDERDAKALASLDRLYERQERWDDLSATIQQRIAVASDGGAGDGGAGADSVTLHNRLAAVYEERLDRPDLAIETLRETLTLSPADGTAVAALERILERPAQRVEAARILAPLYEAEGRWRKLVDALRVLFDAEDDGTARVGILRRIAALEEERLGAPAAAFEANARAFAEDPGLEDVRVDLRRLADALDKWSELAAAYEHELERVVDGPLIEELLRDLAALFEERLTDIEGACRTWKRLLDVEADDPQALDALQRLYTSAERWSDLIAVLERRITTTPDAAEQRPILLRIATLHEEMLDGPDEAGAALRRLLALDPDDAEALEGLERLLRRGGAWPELVEILGRQADGATDPNDRAGILKAAGEVYETRLQGAPEAIAAYRGALDAAPGDAEALAALDRLYGLAEQWLEQLEILEHRQEAAATPQERADLSFRTARLWESHLDDPLRAVDGYKELLAHRPDDERPLDALLAMVQGGRAPQAAADALLAHYRTLLEWERAVEVQEALLEHVSDPAARVALLRDLAGVREREMEDLPGAFDAVARAFAQDPAAAQADELLSDMERLADAGGLWERYVGLLDAQAEAHQGEPALAAGLVLRTAQALEVALEDAAGAIERCRRAMEIDPERTEALVRLDRLYQREGRWEDLSDVLRLRAADMKETEERVALLMRLGALYESALERVDDAVHVYRQILDEAPGHPPTIEALERLFAGPGDSRTISGILDPIYRENRDWEKWLGLQEKVLRGREDPRRRQDLMREVAGVLLSELAQPSRALPWYGRAFQEAPDDDALAEEMERLAREFAEWDVLAGCYIEAHSAVAAPADKARILLRLARVYENERRDLEAAETCYVQVLAFDEAHAEALSALDRLYTLAARWADLADVLRRRIAGVEGQPEGVELHFRLAHLLENELGDLDVAVVSYRRVLEIDPDHEGALKALESIYLGREEWEALFGVYEGLAKIAEGDEGKAEIYARMAMLASGHLRRPSDAVFIWNKVVEMLGEDRRALAALADLHEQESQWEECAEILDRLSRVTEAPEAEADVLTRLGGVLEARLERTEDALECWRRVHAIRPDDADALMALRRLYRETAQHVELADIIEQILDVRPAAMADDPAGAWADLYADLGRVRHDKLHDPEGAAAAWTQVASLRPADLEALTALEGLHTDLGRFAECADVLERKAALLTEDGARVAALLRAGALCEEKLDDRGRALGLYERVHEIAPGDMEASVALERLYIEGEDYEKLLNLLLVRLEIVTDERQRLLLLRQAAALCEEHLRSPEKAFFCLAQGWQSTPGDEELADEMERLARVAGHHETLLDLYEGALQQADPDLQASLHRRIGRVYSDDMGAFEEAISHLEQVKAGTEAGTPMRVEALATLEELYEKAGHWDELVATLSEKLPVEQDPTERTALLNRVGHIWEDKVGDHGRALEVYREVLRQDPGDDDALSAMERIHRAREEWRELTEVLSRRAETTGDPDAVVRHRLSIALLWESALAVPERAVEAYREVLFVEPGEAEACRALERLFRDGERWQELCDVLRARLAATGDEDERAELHTHLAQVLEERFADLDGAVDAYEAVLVGHPDHLDSIGALERLYVRLERWEPLLETYERHLDALAETAAVETRVSLLKAIARVHYERIGDPARAAGYVDRVLEIAPHDAEAMDMLAGIHEARGDWGAVVESLQKRAALVPEADERARVLARIGLVVLQRMKDEERATEQLYTALDHDPRCVEAVDALADIYTAKADWANVVRMLKRKEEVTLDVLDKAAVLHRIGRIYQESLADAIAATDYFERSVALDAENVEASQPLVEMYLYEQKWERAEPLLDMLIRRLGQGREAPEGLHKLYYRAGLVAERLRKTDAALRHYRSAYELDATDLDTLEGLGRLLYEREDWDRAFKVFQTILVHHRETLGDARQVDIFHRLGVMKLKVGERSKALQMFEKALELDPGHRPTLDSLIELHVKQGDHERVVQRKRSLIEHTGDEAEAFALLVEVGDLWREQLRDPGKAVAAYLEALERRPDSKVVLTYLLRLYNESQQWDQAVGVLGRLIGLETDAEKVAKLHNTVAVLYRDKLGDINNAVEHFNACLKAAPGWLKAFEAIDRLLTEAKDWPGLEKNYRRMVKRVKDTGVGGPDLEAMLWRNLGEIYRTRMQRHGDAAMAFAEASRLQPEDQQIHEIIAELYELAGEAEKGIERHQKLIEISPFRVESYKALNRLYMSIGRYDEAWCMCAALAFLREASPEEQQFYQQYKGPTAKLASRSIDPDLWTRAIVHPWDDLRIGNVFALLAQFNPYAVGLKDWNVKKKDRHDLTKPLLFNKAFQYAANTLNLASYTPEVYLKKEQHAGLKNGNTEAPWSLVIGADMLSGKADRELNFLLGRQLALYRAEHYLAGLGLPTANLRLLFFAAWRLTMPAAQVPTQGDAKQFEDMIDWLGKTIPRPRLVDVQKSIQNLVSRSEADINLSRWVQGVDHTATRVGLLLCGDLETAARMVKNDPHPISKATPKERVKELVLYSVGDTHFAARKALGVDIGG